MNPDQIRNEMKLFNPEPVVVPKPVKKKDPPKEHKKHPGYFEGELHLRNVTPEILSYVARRIYSDGEHIAKEKKYDSENIDYWVSSRALLRRLGKELQQKFGGELIASEKLFTRDHQTSRDLYRLNVSYRHHERVPGEIIAILGEPWKIMSFKGKRIIVEHAYSKKRKNIIRKNAEQPLETKKTSVVQTEPELHVLDENFQSVVARGLEKYVPGQKVTAVEINGVWFIID